MKKMKPRRQVLVVQAWWSQRFLEGVARYAMDNHWILDCEMGWTGNLPEKWKGDGIIVYADRDPKIIQFVRKCRAPIVDVSTFRDDFNAPRVMISNEQIVKEAIDHLISLGFEHLGCVHSTDHPVDSLRHSLFEKEVKKRGKQFHKMSLNGLVRHLKSLPTPMGLMATADHYAARIIRACGDAGYTVPEDFAVVSINNTPIFCDLTSIPITSVDPNFEKNGYEAAALLDRVMDRKKVPKKTLVPPKGIFQRRSTDTLCIPDADTAKALRYLRDHFLEPISVLDAAAATQSPLRKIQSRFHRFTGRTMIQELSRLRMDHARKLLKETKYKIDHVGRESGFSSRTYFIRAFRKSTGMTPRNYRMSMTS